MTIKSALCDLNNALLDLQAADYDTYDRPLKRMAAALAADDLGPVVTPLRSRVDFDSFIARSQRKNGAGSEHLDWPTDREEELGLAIALIERAASDPRWFLNFAHRYYSATSSRIIATIQKVTTSVFIPFNRDFVAHVEAWEARSSTQATADTEFNATGLAIAARTGSATATGTATAQGETSIDPTRWTGLPSRTARLTLVRGQIEAAHDAIGYLITDLASDDGNGGPLLDEHSEALDVLRNLHRTIGELISAIDCGKLDDELGEGFAAEIGRFGGRWLASLRDDPARYFIGFTSFAALTACGLGNWAGFVSGAALGVSRRKSHDDKRGI